MSWSSPESSGDASPPGDRVVAILSRNLEVQQELPPTPQQTNNVVGHVYWCPPTMIVEIMFRFKLLFFGKHKVLYSVCILYLVCILYPVCSLQSAVCSLQSAVCSLHAVNTAYVAMASNCFYVFYRSKSFALYRQKETNGDLQKIFLNYYNYMPSNKAS